MEINITEEEKQKLKITSVSTHELSFKIGFKTFQIYNYKDGDFSIEIEDGKDNIEILFNERQIDIIKKFLINEL